MYMAEHMDQTINRFDDSRNFISQLYDADLDALYSLGKRFSFAKNDFIFKAGETDLNIWVLQSGRVKLFGSSVHGREVLLSFVLAGEIFGLAECLQEQPRLIYASAAEACEGVSIPHTQFKEWLGGRPEIACVLMKILAWRMREYGQRFLSLANGNIKMGVAQLMVRLGATYGEQVGPHIHVNSFPLTVQDIADMVGASRQSVSTCLAEMKREGILDCVRHIMIIKQEARLQQIANGKLAQA